MISIQVVGETSIFYFIFNHSKKVKGRILLTLEQTKTYKNEILKIMPGDNGLMVFHNTFGELTNGTLVFFKFRRWKKVPPPEKENALEIKQWLHITRGRTVVLFLPLKLYC